MGLYRNSYPSACGQNGEPHRCSDSKCSSGAPTRSYHLIRALTREHDVCPLVLRTIGHEKRKAQGCAADAEQPSHRLLTASMPDAQGRMPNAGKVAKRATPHAAVLGIEHWALSIEPYSHAA